MIDLADYGYHGPAEIDGLLAARITAVHREKSLAICAHGEVSTVLTGTFQRNVMERADLPTVGDYALIRHNPIGDSLIERLLPRTSQFSRLDNFGHASRFQKLSFEQVVAANFDYVFIMSSLNQDFNLSRIQRYLTAAYESGAMPLVVLTKADLTDRLSEQIRAVEDIAIGVPVSAVSARTGQGLDQLSPYVAPGKTSVFLGMSGIGKSSLLNALAGEERMRVNEIREDDARGRHTTTHRQLIRLPSGGLVIDTPGMRELGLWDADEGIGAAFSDVEALFDGCRFADCRHESEPGCAVRSALESGALSEKRWTTYQAQKREVAYAMDRTKYAQQRTQKFKQIAKQLRQNPSPKR